MITWKELKERRLFQIVASYAVAGWVILGIFDQVIDRGVLPEITYRVLLILYFGGMGAALVVGWYHGEKGEQQVTRPEVVLLSLMGLLTLGSMGMTLRSHLRVEQVRLAAGEAGLPLERVAVLFFQDRTRGDDDLGYLADGLTESLIDRLSESRTLNVLSRNASDSVRDSTLPLDSIARLLGAGTLVDGTVEQRGEDVRVRVSLVDGASGEEIQSGTVDQPLEDVLALQGEVADQVAVLLGRWLLEEVDLRQARSGTQSAAAWILFQRGERRRETGLRSFEAGNQERFAAEFREADSLYAEAEREDPDWVAPLVQRGSLTDLLAQAAAFEDPRKAESWVNAGLQYVDRALVEEPRDARAHLVRGRLEYLRWRSRLAVDPRAEEESFRRAITDLEEATRLDPSLAEAWSILSLLYSENSDNTNAKLAAQRAYEADEFLRSADEVLFRLYATSYDLEQFRDATEYCDLGRKRFPRQIVFRECPLWLMAAPSPQAPAPDPERAWDLLDQYLAVAPDPEREFRRRWGEMLVAGILGKAELTDSAEAVLVRARGTTEVDPEMELMGLEALIRLQMGEDTKALEVLKTYLTLNPHHAEGLGLTSHWWWRPLQDNPEFRRLIGG